MRALLVLLLVAATITAARRVVDGHVHLTNTSLLRYTWQKSLPELDRTWTVGALAAAAAGSGLEPSDVVFIEVSAVAEDWDKEITYIQGLADRLVQHPSVPQIKGIVGHVALQAEGVGAKLDGIMASAPLFRGVRQGESAGFLNSSDFVRGVCALGERGLVFDVLCGPADFPQVAALARACPKTRLILDHMGSPAISDGRAGYDAWAPGLEVLAALGNVFVKVSGAPGEAARGVRGNWTADEVAPFVEHSVRAFGYERAFFAGNWFFLDLAGTYTTWAAAVTQILSGMGPDPTELDSFFSTAVGTAYGLPR